MKKLLAKIIGATTALAMAIGVGVAVGNNTRKAEPVYASDGSITFSSGAFNNNTITWSSSGILTILQERNGSGNTAPNSSYVSNPRWYSGNRLTFTPGSGITITSMTITATSNAYATTLATSTWSIGSASANNTVVTWTGSASSAFTVTMGGQSRLSTSMSFVYSTGGGEPVGPTQLSAPVPQYNQETNRVTWAAVANASSYKVSVDDDEHFSTASSPYDGNFQVGTEYTVYVKAIGDGNDYSDSPAGSVTFTVPAPFESKNYSLCTSVGDLEAGKSYLITSGTTGTPKTMATTSNTNNRPSVNVTVTNSIIASTSDILTVTLGGSSGSWTFHTDNYLGTAGYFASGTGSNNHLKVVEPADTCTISFDANAAVITFSTNPNGRNVLMFNSTNNLFACYSDGQSPVYLWKEMSNKTIQANSLTIKSGVTTISGTYEPNEPYYFGGTLDLTASQVNYQQGEDYQNGAGAINWTSNNTNVATVENGIVTFVSAGTSLITGTAVDKGAENATISSSFTLDISNAGYAPGSSNNPYTVAQALAASPSNGVYVTGIISTITEVSTAYNNATYRISDDGSASGEMIIYHGKYTGNTNFTAEHQIKVGDIVTVTGNLTEYNQANQLGQNNYITSLTPVHFTVSYNANGADSGTVPSDSNEYSRNISTGENVFNTKGNEGNLQKAGYTFNGWNTKADPTANGAVHYNAQAEYDISENLTLYAEWLSVSPSITVQSELTGYTGEQVDLDFTYGNIANPANISVVASNNKVTVGDCIALDGDGVVTITFNTAGNDAYLEFKNGDDVLATCSVTVNQSTVSITGLPASRRIKLNETSNLGNTITVTHTGTYFNNNVTWASSDNDVASVNSSGVVTAKAIGEATITVTSNSDNSVFKTCKVFVIKGSLGAEWDLSIDETSSASTSQLAWTGTYANMTVDKDGSGTNANNYYPGTQGKSYTSTRFYTNSVLTIEPAAGYCISSIVFEATQASYATALNNSSWTNATSSVSSSIVTVVPTDSSASVSATIGGTCGFTSVVVNIDPSAYLKSEALAVATINADEHYTDEVLTSVDSVILRFGARISQDTWNAINTNWTITDYGVMLMKKTDLDASEFASVKDAFFGGTSSSILKIVNKRLGGAAYSAPYLDGDDYLFTVRVHIDDNAEYYDDVLCAVPYIVAGGDYCFLTEKRESVQSLAGKSTSGVDTALTTAALNYLKVNH